MNFVAGAAFPSFASVARRTCPLCIDPACSRPGSLWRRANSSCPRRTLCRDPACRSSLAVAPCKCVLLSANHPACRSALAVAPCECVLLSANPVRRSCLSRRSRCGAARMRLALGEPSAEILLVQALLLWRRSVFLFPCLRIGVWKLSVRVCSHDGALSRVPPAWSTAPA